MSSWLYPISATAGYYFEDDGRRVAASYEAFRDLILTRKIRDDSWVVRQCFSRLQLGDDLFIYTGDGNRGIVGYARVTDLDAGRQHVVFELDRAKTTQLLAHPVPAQLIRPLIPPPRKAVIDISGAMRHLQPLLPWALNRRRSSDPELLKLKLRPITLSKALIKGGLRNVHLQHDTVLAPVRTFLRARQFRVGAKRFSRLGVDLVGHRRGNLVIVEAKMSPPGKGRDEARQGLGQLLEYSWHFKRAVPRVRLRHHLWLAFSTPPERGVRAFLRDQGVIVSWPTRRGLTVKGAERLTCG